MKKSIVISMIGALLAIINIPVSEAVAIDTGTPAPSQQGKTPQSPMPKASAIEKFDLDVQGMKADSDSAKIEQELKRIPGVVSIRCDRNQSACRTEIDPSRIKKEDLVFRLNKLGYHAQLKTGDKLPTVKGVPQ